MPSFNAPFSSSPPPSTPDSKFGFSKGRSMFSDMPENPSTTPAGPPPRSAASFTPTGLPPSSAFGSTPFGGHVSKLNLQKKSDTTQPPSFQTSMPPPASKGLAGRAPKPGFYTVPDTSLLSEDNSSEGSDQQRDQGQEDTDYGSGMDDSMQLGESAGNFVSAKGPNMAGQYGFKSKQTNLRSSIFDMNFKPSPGKTRSSPPKPSRKISSPSRQLPRKGNPDIIPRIALQSASAPLRPNLVEPDAMILETENLVDAIYHQLDSVADEETGQRMLAVGSLELVKTWYEYGPLAQKIGDEVGPGSDATELQNATYLSSLLLALRHPPAIPTPFREAGPMALGAPAQPMPVPRVLLDWLSRNHTSYHALANAVRSAKPNCTAHPEFWEVIYGLLLRGQIQPIVQLFSDADFQHANSALDDGGDGPAYHGAELQAVQSAIHRSRELLKACPASHGDWNVDSLDWDVFRNKVSAELEHLSDYEDGSDEDDDLLGSSRPRNFGLPKQKPLLPRMTKKTQHRLPLGIYQRLKGFYLIMLGSTDEIIAASQDWLEATVALTVWWDGTQEMSVATWSMDVSRAQRSSKLRTTEDPFLARISAAFLCVTDPSDDGYFQINSLRPIEVALASILQGNVEGVLGILRQFSVTIVTAVAEVASLGGWLESSDTNNEDSGLDDDDLMVLNYGNDDKSITTDKLLISYAEKLIDREELMNDDDKPHEGWELAIPIASRVSDPSLARSTITSFLDDIQLDSQDRLDKLLNLCSSLGLESEARNVAERFADHLTSTTSEYGPALICYARAHASAKIRQLVDLLVSYSLVQSAAFPSPNETDESLRLLTESPKRAFAKLSQSDSEAAAMLRYYITGYACLRRFYILRDQHDGTRPTSKDGPSADKDKLMLPHTRRKEAIKALIAVINSAADSIYGGLYDASRDSAIQVEALLTLLAEATVFFAPSSESRRSQPTSSNSNPGPFSLSASQITDILAAIEDLETVSVVNSRIAEASEEGLRAALGSWRGVEKPSLREIFKKSVSRREEGEKGGNGGSGTGSSFSFSLLGSEMLERGNLTRASTGAGGERGGGRSVGGSAVLVERDRERETAKNRKGKGDSSLERKWDWRSRFGDCSSEIKAGDVLGFLRRNIVGALARAELERR